MSTLSPGHAFGPLLLAHLDIAENLFHLLPGGLGAHLRRRVERIADPDPRDTGNRALHELVEDRFLDQRARRAGTKLTLVECEERKAFKRLIEKIVVGI